MPHDWPADVCHLVRRRSRAPVDRGGPAGPGSRPPGRRTTARREHPDDFYDAELLRLRAHTRTDPADRQADITAAFELARRQGATPVRIARRPRRFRTARRNRARRTGRCGRPLPGRLPVARTGTGQGGTGLTGEHVAGAPVGIVVAGRRSARGGGGCGRQCRSMPRRRGTGQQRLSVSAARKRAPTGPNNAAVAGPGSRRQCRRDGGEVGGLGSRWRSRRRGWHRYRRACGYDGRLGRNGSTRVGAWTSASSTTPWPPHG